MPFDSETIEIVFEKSDGKCYYCGKQLAWANYGRRDGRGGWEIDHSLPKSRGGTDHLNNLVASCWTCNLNKSDSFSRTFKRYAEPLKQERKRKQVEKVVKQVFGAIAIFALIVGGVKLVSNWNERKESSPPPLT